MTDQNTFMEILHDVSSIIKTSDHPMTDEEVLAYFDDMELSPEQKKMVVDYLMNHAEEINAELEEESGQAGIDEAEKNSKVLKAYMEDISLIETYTEEETIVLYDKLLSGQREVIEAISHAWVNRVVAVARKYADVHSRLEDLIQEGNMAVLMRLNELCGAAESEVTESAAVTADGRRITASEIEGELLKEIENGILSYVSEWNSAKEQENSLIGKLSLVHEARQFLKEQNGEYPTLSELSEFTKMSEEELSELNSFIEDKK